MNQCYDEMMIEDLNEILKGCHMGINVFRDILAEAQNSRFKTILKNALEVFHRHEIELTVRIRNYSTSVDDSLSVMSSVSELVEKFKTVIADSDEQLLANAIRAMDMAMKACKVFDEKHPVVPQQIKEILDQLLQDYKQIYRELTEFRLSF